MRCENGTGSTEPETVQRGKAVLNIYPDLFYAYQHSTLNDFFTNGHDLSESKCSSNLAIDLGVIALDRADGSEASFSNHLELGSLHPAYTVLNIDRKSLWEPKGK